MDEVTVIAPGINGKMSEFNAALGLLQLQYIDEAIDKRKIIDTYYKNAFYKVKGIQCIQSGSDAELNYSYFPILVQPAYHSSRDKLYEKLKINGINARRYFYPLISEFPMYCSLPSAMSSNLPVATRIANEIICLPIYPDLTKNQMDLIVNVIKE